MAAARTFRVLPGFNLTLGYTLGYMSLLILIPFIVLGLQALQRRRRPGFQQPGGIAGV